MKQQQEQEHGGQQRHGQPNADSSGSARGLGAATAEAMVAGGAKVVIADILDKEGRESAAKLGATGMAEQDVCRLQASHGAPDGPSA